MGDQNKSTRVYSRERRTSTWEFLPKLEPTPRNSYKFHETVVKDRHLFKPKGRPLKRKKTITSQSEEVEFPTVNQIQLSLEIDNSYNQDGMCSTLGSSHGESSPKPSPRFNEPLGAYIATRKKTNQRHTPGYMEAFPRSLPSVDQTTLARKLVTKQRVEQRQEMILGPQTNDTGLLPLLRLSHSRSNVPLQRLPGPRPQHTPANSLNSVKDVNAEQTVRVWDPTMMDSLMRAGKVLVPR